MYLNASSMREEIEDQFETNSFKTITVFSPIRTRVSYFFSVPHSPALPSETVQLIFHACNLRFPVTFLRTK